MVARTNYLAENFFGELEHDERRRSGHKNLGHDLEIMPAGAALVRNLERDDYVTIVCGSLDRLAQSFAELDRDEHQRKSSTASRTKNMTTTSKASCRSKALRCLQRIAAS